MSIKFKTGQIVRLSDISDKAMIVREGRTILTREEPAPRWGYAGLCFVPVDVPFPVTQNTYLQFFTSAVVDHSDFRYEYPLQMLDAMMSRLSVNSTGKARDRIILTLMELATISGDSLKTHKELPLTASNIEIAMMSGLSREHVGTIVSDLVEEGYIRKQGSKHKFMLSDPREGLARVAA